MGNYVLLSSPGNIKQQVGNNEQEGESHSMATLEHAMVTEHFQNSPWDIHPSLPGRIKKKKKGATQWERINAFKQDKAGVANTHKHHTCLPFRSGYPARDPDPSPPRYRQVRLDSAGKVLGVSPLKISSVSSRIPCQIIELFGADLENRTMDKAEPSPSQAWTAAGGISGAAPGLQRVESMDGSIFWVVSVFSY